MASINKTSVRDELDRIKSEFKRQHDTNAMTHENMLLMKSMLTLLELIISIFLEKTTKKNSKNSSIPSSQTGKDESSVDDKGSKGKGKPETKQRANNTRTVESVTLSQVTFCNVCGEDISDAPCIGHERRSKIDIVFEKVVEHIDAEVKNCSTCNAQVKGDFPADMPGPLQYGNGLKAFVISMLVCQMVSLNRVQKSVKAMIGQIISEATLLKFVFRLHVSLEKWEQSAIDSLLKKKS